MTQKKKVDGLAPIEAQLVEPSAGISPQRRPDTSTAMERFLAWEPRRPQTAPGLSGLSLEDVREIQPLLMEVLTAHQVAPAQVAQAGMTPYGTAEYEVNVLRAQLEAAERATLFPAEARSKIAKIEGELRLLEAQQDSLERTAAHEATIGEEQAAAKRDTQRARQKDAGKALEQELLINDRGRDVELEKNEVELERERLKIANERAQVDVAAEKAALTQQIVAPAEIRRHETTSRHEAWSKRIQPYRRYILIAFAGLVLLTIYANITVDGGRSVPVLNQINSVWDWFWQPIMDYIMRR